MMKPPANPSAWPSARTIGVVYLLYFVTAVTAVLLVKGLVVANDAGTTASNILAHQALYRSGFALGLLASAVYIVLVALLYGLFEPVNRSVSLTAAFLGLAGCAVQIVGSLFQAAPLIVLGNVHLLSAFTPEQVRTMALLVLGLQRLVFHMALVLFGFYLVGIGYLVVRSTFLPRWLGGALLLAGLAWLTYLWPPLATSYASFVQPFGFLAEFALMLWLIVRGGHISAQRALQ